MLIFLVKKNLNERTKCGFFELGKFLKEKIKLDFLEQKFCELKKIKIANKTKIQ
jgi:hypothetical protein